MLGIWKLLGTTSTNLRRRRRATDDRAAAATASAAAEIEPRNAYDLAPLSNDPAPRRARPMVRMRRVVIIDPRTGRPRPGMS